MSRIQGKAKAIDDLLYSAGNHIAVREELDQYSDLFKLVTNHHEEYCEEYSNKYGIDSVKTFDKDLHITTKPTTEDIVLKLLKNIDISKAAGIDNLPGRSLKDGAVILEKPVTKICNLSIKLRIFPVVHAN